MRRVDVHWHVDVTFLLGFDGLQRGRHAHSASPWHIQLRAGVNLSACEITAEGGTRVDFSWGHVMEYV